MKRDVDLRRWRSRARETILGRRQRPCPGCGGTESDMFSVDGRTDVICRSCGAVLRRLIELQPTYLEVVG